MLTHSRRRFLHGCLGLAGLGPLAGCGLPVPGWQRKVPRIGFLAVGSREGWRFLVDGFLEGLREHGYTEGQNILIEYRFSDDGCRRSRPSWPPCRWT